MQTARIPARKMDNYRASRFADYIIMDLSEEQMDNISSMTLVLMSAERYVSVAYPSKSLTWKTGKNLGIAIGGVWAAATLLHIGLLQTRKSFT